MNGVHPADDLELYAIGALEPVERAAVEAHITGCTQCQARVADAATVAGALAETLPAYEPPASLERRILGAAGANVTPLRPRWRWAAALAAAAAFVGILGWQERTLSVERAQHHAALLALVRSHFKHVGMRPVAAAAPVAKVLYARDGAWVYVIVDGRAPGVHVTLERHGATRDAGALRVEGGLSTLYVGDAGRPDGVTLRAPSGTVDTATLAY